MILKQVIVYKKMKIGGKSAQKTVLKKDFFKKEKWNEKNLRSQFKNNYSSPLPMSTYSHLKSNFPRSGVNRPNSHLPLIIVGQRQDV